jgi:hypothetical protein
MFFRFEIFFRKFLLLPSNGEKKLSPANDLIGILWNNHLRHPIGEELLLDILSSTIPMGSKLP